jgi:beta-N-acetylhexosaminidase
LAGAGLAALGLGARTVLLASVREPLVKFGLAVSLAGLAAASYAVYRQSRRSGGAGPSAASAQALGLSLVLVWLAALAAFATTALHFASHRGIVLQSPRDELAAVGRHVIVGYRNLDELGRLVALGAVGGVFVTARNAAGKPAPALAAEIAGLQTLARDNGHPPLLIATDQEGGFVSRLSPPLPRPAQLAHVIAPHADGAQREAAVKEHAFDVGRSLASVGVTLNFAPVADLDFGIRLTSDLHSRISERAISGDPELVGEVARAYCQGLAAAGVLCTLKHFPGLGRVRGDTHITSASLVQDTASLAETDWRPYRMVLKDTNPAVMMAHVVVPAIDASRPASTSRAVIAGILRGGLGFDGLVVTDDLTMVAASGGPGGIGRAGVEALQAGADMLLVAYDTDQVYALIDALLDARRQGLLPAAQLDAAARRIRSAWARPAGADAKE